MDKGEIKKLIADHKYIFIGEIHGTKEIPNLTLEFVLPAIKNRNVIFFLEIPKESEKELYKYLNSTINKRRFLNSVYLFDAIFDKRITNDILVMCKKLKRAGVKIKGLENYSNGNPYERDKDMAKRFLKVVNNKKGDKYIVYIGNLHLLEKSFRINKFKLDPFKAHLPKRILKKALTIQFNKNNEEGINFKRMNNVVNIGLNLKLVDKKSKKTVL